MALTLSTSHQTARQDAARLPALQASYDLLTSSPGDAVLQLYAGDPDTGTLIAELPMPPSELDLDTGALQIVTTAALEGQAMVAGTVSHARILDGAGNWWADATVTDENGTGDIHLQDTTLQAGAFARITSAVFQG